jgi:hypothetical protein
MQHINLARVPREIHRKFGTAVTYSQLYKAVIHGDIEAKHSNGRWYISDDDLGAVADHFKAKSSREAA